MIKRGSKVVWPERYKEDKLYPLMKNIHEKEGEKLSPSINTHPINELNLCRWAIL